MKTLHVLIVITLWWLPAPSADAKGDKPHGFTFAQHPRLKYVLEDLVEGAGKDDVPKWTKAVSEAEKILKKTIEVPKEGGQWEFYYACPDHNCSLVLRDSEHVCPRCGKAYMDKRTRLAYVTMQYNRIDRDVLTLAKAWHFSRREEFAAEVYRILAHYSEIYPELKRHDRWGRKGMFAIIGGKRFCQSLTESVSIITLAKAYDLVYNWKGVDEGTRAKIEQDLFTASVNCIYRFYSLYDARNNHTTWYNAAAATVGAVLGRSDLLDKAINGAKGLRFQFTNSVNEEGLWHEGTIAYHYYALQAIAETVQAALACGEDLTGEPALKKLYLAPLQLTYPNGQLPAVNDGDQAYIRQYRNLYCFAARTWNDPEIKAFADSGNVVLLPSAVYEDTGLAYLRRGAGENAVVAILDFGRHGGHHGHPDKLNLMLYALGSEIFLDPGRLTYRCPEHKSWTRQTVAHNTVVINQKSQLPEPGTMLHFASQKEFDAVVGESATTYPGVTLIRALVLFDRALVDLFYVTSDRKMIIDWILHGQAGIVPPEGLQTRRKPIHASAGYQHLTDLHEAEMAKDFHVDWQLSEKRFLRTHVLSNHESTVFSGNGIGYQLSDKVPFFMLRRKAKQTAFIAVHDLSGKGATVSLPRGEIAAGAVSVSLSVDGQPWQIQWEIEPGMLKVKHGKK